MLIPYIQGVCRNTIWLFWRWYKNVYILNRLRTYTLLIVEIAGMKLIHIIEFNEKIEWDVNVICFIYPHLVLTTVHLCTLYLSIYFKSVDGWIVHPKYIITIYIIYICVCVGMWTLMSCNIQLVFIYINMHLVIK